jgi:hypothetical protein
MRRLKIPRITQVRFPLKLSCYETVMKTVSVRDKNYKTLTEQGF